MSLDSKSEDSPEIEGVDALVASFASKESDPRALRIGMEHEKFGLLTDTLAPLPYSGPRSIEAVFTRMVDDHGFDRFNEGGDTIALVKDGTSISLEPGCQLELSGAVLHDNFETCRELTEHRDLVGALGEELGIVWLGVGHTPFARLEDFEWPPKERYRIMRRYLPTRGRHGLEMMVRTGTVQSNFDYASEADMVDKMQTALAVTPIVSAIYANSAIVEGEVAPYTSVRQQIWLDVDPDRTGLTPWIMDDDFGYRAWVEWALDVPMFFIRRGGRYLGGVTGTPFRHFLEHGFEGYRARATDWSDHLSTLFPEVRLKEGYLEVRGADCCDRDLNCAHPALWKGILYDDDARAAARALMVDLDADARERLRRDVARDGLAARTERAPVIELARELVAIARAGLRRLHPITAERDETGFLDPIDRLLEERGASPGRIAAELWEGELGRDPRRLVEHYRF